MARPVFLFYIFKTLQTNGTKSGCNTISIKEKQTTISWINNEQITLKTTQYWQEIYMYAYTCWRYPMRITISFNILTHITSLLEVIILLCHIIEHPFLTYTSCIGIFWISLPYLLYITFDHNNRLTPSISWSSQPCPLIQ